MEGNKYKTGVYHLHLFDKHGSRADMRISNSFTAAQQDGDELIKNPPYASYVITRVMKNTLDNAWPWDIKEDTRQEM
jgi:hypothetical protein